jgi:SAM-dependent methyltransferase
MSCLEEAPAVTEQIDTLPRPEGWNGSDTAKQYDAFVQRFPMYRETSADLVDHLGIPGNGKILDLACGTGVTTGVLLERLGEDGVVWAVDASEPMLAIARTRVPDSRVRWRSGKALDVARLIEHGLDDAVCNSAIWQLGHLRSVFAAVRTVLHPGGQFACNWGEGFIADAPPGGSVNKQDLPLIEVARSHALLGSSGRLAFQPSPWPSIDQVVSAIESAGFDLIERWWVQQSSSPEARYEWWKVPAFSDWFLGHVPHERRRELVNEAWARWDPKGDSIHHWFSIRAKAV